MLALVLLLPFLAFSLVKPGTMLATDGQGRVMMILCGGAAPVEMAVAADGSIMPAKDVRGQGMAHGSCDWVPHTQSLLGAGAVQPPELQRIAMAAAPVAAPQDAICSRLAITATARGPPRIV